MVGVAESLRVAEWKERYDVTRDACGELREGGGGKGRGEKERRVVVVCGAASWCVMASRKCALVSLS